jgi:acyl carrier protein
MDSLLPEVQEVFRAVFDQPELVVTRESNASTIDDWDSLAHINLVTALAMRFKIKFALGELEDLKDVGDMLDLMRKKIDAKTA